MDFLIAMLAAFLVALLVAVILPRGRLTLVAIPILMVAGFLLSGFGVPAQGSNDPAGHGMALGFYAFIVGAGLVGAALGWLAQLARYVWPAMVGWRYALAVLALVTVSLAISFALVG